MKQLLILLAFLGFAQLSFAQGVINVSQDPAIESALQRHKEINRSLTQISGWCVQLMASSDRDKVMQLKTQFLSSNPDIRVDWEYERPFFKLKAGAYRTKLEAARLLYLIKKQYPGAYITRGKFSPQEF